MNISTGKVRLLGMAAALAAVTGTLASAPAAAKGGGGGVHYIYVPVYSYRQMPPQPYQAPADVELPLEITDTAPANMAGTIAPHGVIAQQEVRARDAVVLLAPFTGGRREMPAGTVLTRVEVRENGFVSPAWCDMRPNDEALLAVKYDCLSGAPDGVSLYGLYSVETDDDLTGVSGDEQPHFRQRFEPAIAARAARPEERPKGLVGYEWCGGDASGDAPKFEVAASFQGGPWEESQHHQCVFGAWTEDHAAVVVDRVSVTVTGPINGKSLSFKAEGRAPAGAMARLVPGGPILTQAEADTQVTEATVDLGKALVLEPFEGKVVGGAVNKGDVLMTRRAHLGVTGVLTADVWRGTHRGPLFTTLPGHALLTTGQVVFGRRVDVQGRPTLVWCAPHKSDEGRLDKAICLPSDGHGTLAVEARPALMPSDLMMPRYPDYVSPPQVKQAPEVLPSFTFTYVFKGWGRAGAEIGEQVDWGEGPMQLSPRVVPLSNNGRVVLPVSGGTLVLLKGETPDTATAIFHPTLVPALGLTAPDTRPPLSLAPVRNPRPPPPAPPVLAAPVVAPPTSSQ